MCYGLKKKSYFQELLCNIPLVTSCYRNWVSCLSDLCTVNWRICRMTMPLRLDDRSIDFLFVLLSRQRNSGRYLPTNETFEAWEKGNDYNEDVKVGLTQKCRSCNVSENCLMLRRDSYWRMFLKTISFKIDLY